MSAGSESNNLYKIGAIATLTGLSTHTIRAWERRYGMELSNRTEGGTRLYDEQSLSRLKIIKQLLDHGESISVLCDLGVDELLERLGKFGSASRFSLNDSRLVFTGSLKVGVYGKSPFSKKSYTLVRGGTLVIEFTSSLESDFVDFVERNESELDCGLVCVDFVNAKNLESLITLSRRFPSTGWILLFNMGANSDLIQLMDRGYHLIRGPLPEAPLVNSIGVHLYQPLQSKNESEPVSKAFEERLFTPERLEEIMNSGGGRSGDYAGHLSMLIQNLTLLEDFGSVEIAQDDEEEVQTDVRSEVIKARNILENALAKICDTDVSRSST